MHPVASQFSKTFDQDIITKADLWLAGLASDKLHDDKCFFKLYMKKLKLHYVPYSNLTLKLCRLAYVVYSLSLYFCFSTSGSGDFLFR